MFTFRWLDKRFREEGFETVDGKMSVFSENYYSFAIVTLQTLEEFLKVAKISGIKLIQYQILGSKRRFPYFFVNGVCYKLNNDIVEPEHI